MKENRVKSPRGTAEFADIALELLDHLDAMVAFWDRNQVCVFANRAYFSWFGKTPEQIVGSTMEQLLGPIYPLNLPYIRAALAGQRQQFERAIPRPGGGVRDSLATYTPFVVDGEVRGFFVHVVDVTPLKELERELEAARAKAHQLATHDFLTGLPNRVLLMDRITLAMAAATRPRQKVAVMSLDLDNLKAINDTHGHAAGDALLVGIASRLRLSLRPSEFLSRIGGDEFVLVASEIESLTQVRTLADRMLDLIVKPVHFDGVDLVPAASIGVAIYPSDGSTPEALVARSDAALYAAKKRGGRQYRFSARVTGGCT